MKVRLWAGLCLCIGLLACGGGGGGGSSTPPIQTAPLNNAGGIWFGSIYDEYYTNWITYAASNDSGYLVYSQNAIAGDIQNAIVGSIQLAGTDSDCTGSGPAYWWAMSEPWTAIWNNGNIKPYTSYNGNWNDQISDIGSISLTFDPLYDRPVAISSLAGTYTQNSSNNAITNVIITEEGFFNIDNFNGTISLIDATKNLFSVSIDSSSYTGLAWWSDGQSKNFLPNSLYIIWVGNSGENATILTNTAGSVEILNASGQNITGVWIAPHPETVWGSNLLTGTIANGASLSFANITPGNYDCQVQLADSTFKQDINFQVSASMASTFTVP